MTKKDYILQAEAIRDSKSALEYASLNLGETQRAIQVVAYTLANRLQKDNPKFDKNRFITACGLIAV